MPESERIPTYGGDRLASLDEMGLHDHQFVDFGPDDWWACTAPERPLDYYVVIDWRCPKCVMKTRADLVINGDQISHMANKTSWNYGESMPLSRALAIVDEVTR